MAEPVVDPVAVARVPHALVARIPTGAKVFLILSAALLPLAVIAFFASVRITQIADENGRAQLRVAASESARKVAIELIGDMNALRTTVVALEADRDDAPSCARAQGVFAPQSMKGTSFVVTDRAGRVLCGTPLARDMALAPGLDGAVTSRILPQRGVVLAVGAPGAEVRALAFFPAAVLATTGRTNGFAIPYEAELRRGAETLMLTELPNGGPLERRETLDIDLGIGDLTLQTSVRRAPITSPVLIAMLLPFLMWAAAAGIGWFIVDRLLIRPLRILRSSVAGYVPGRDIDLAEMSALPAQEIRELGETFRNISRVVARHEAGLAEGLVRQTRLTREVHHRVKNNLQVISSLINFHARGSRGPEATNAYSSIQRRVDALAVVHRHHFAEMEENRGLSLRSVIGELASNIRATAPEGSAQLGIAIDVEPYLVTQDVAIAVAFLITEIVELAMTLNPAAQVRLSVKPAESDGHVTLRVSSPSLLDGDIYSALVSERYGRVMEGLSRQLRSKLHHDPLVGAYEIAIAVTGRD